MADKPRQTVGTSGVNIEAWTNEALQALRTVHISSNVFPRETQHSSHDTLEIPLDTIETSVTNVPAEVGNRATAERNAYPSDTIKSHPPKKTLLRRDSLKRREALLKGKEGSRRRQRWENDRLIGNPWAEPPEPRDLEPRPTYPVQTVPYFLAPLWDERQVRNKIEKAAKARESTLQSKQDSAGRIPKELRDKLKRSKGAKTLLQDLEQRVREFVVLWENKERQLAEDGFADIDTSSEDEEIVFVGRNGQIKESSGNGSARQLQRDKLIFDSLVDDHGAGFGRWLVHSIAAYYNLQTWSITRGTPARREAYVGMKKGNNGPGCGPDLDNGLPRPLWAIV